MNVGYGINIPGVPDSLQETFKEAGFHSGGDVPGVIFWNQEMSNKYGFRILDGTGDILICPKHAEYKKLANEYALKYNHLLMQHIASKEKALPSDTNLPKY